MQDQLRHYQKRWAYEKYYVMAHSQQHYAELRRLFQGNEWSIGKADRFEAIMAEVELMVPTDKTLRTAYQHVWGYFKKVASSEERERYKYLDAFLPTHKQEMLDFLMEMTKTYQPAYLVHCRLIEEGLHIDEGRLP